MPSQGHDCEVYYAINDCPEFLFMARHSALGIRRFNATLPISLVVYGEPDAAFREDCRAHDLDLIVRPAAQPHQLMYLKLLALAHVSQTRRLLFVDADTLPFGDIQAMFDAYRDADIYAREEMDVREGAEKCQIDHVALASVRGRYGVGPVPIYNTGVIVLNHRVQSRIAAVLSDFEDVRERFLSGEVPYPCNNKHIVGEMTTAIVLGRIAGLTTGFIDPAMSPFFVELDEGKVVSPGLLLHTFRAYYENSLFNYGDEAAIAGFRAARAARRQKLVPWQRRDA